MATKFSHSRQASSGTSSMTLPPSPTLTNPDMILPDYDRAPSPEELPPSQLTAWRTAHASPLDFHLPQSNYSSTPVNISTPIIYGNGTMLSDIGEVTEVESTVGGARRSSSRYSMHSNDAHDDPPALPLAKSVIKSRSQMKRERRSSVDSTSTITTERNPGHFADFDDTVSVNESCQGDDEESIASYYMEDPAIRKPRSSGADELPGQNTDRYSTSSISKRAEEILANAKRRLTTMEGNLTRARSSLNNYSTMSDSSTPSPPMIRPSSAMRIAGGSASVSYSRNIDEALEPDNPAPAAHLPRSASALGAAGGYRQPRGISRSFDGSIEGAIRPSGFMGPEITLMPLGEEDDDQVSVIGPQDDGRLSSMSSFASPTFSTYSESGRAASVVQVRDLQDQMNGLRGKISSLKEQARADSMKRRSLQSLRTPSPFTHARWDQGFMEPQDIRSPDAEEHPQTTTPPQEEVQYDHVDAPAQSPEEAAHVANEGVRNGDMNVEEDPRSETDQSVPHHQPTSRDDDEETQFDDAEDLRTENGDFEDAREGPDLDIAEVERYETESESGESLYHDTFQAPVSHEDREDAFDYEHFFLHSAMGTISQGRFGRSGSVSSDDSLQTARGPIMDSRPGSIQTMSSIDSFATAYEGRSSSRSILYEESGEDDEETQPRPRGHKGSKSLGHLNGARGDESGSESLSDGQDKPRRNSVIHQPLKSNSASLHRPSVASFESTGTTRSFPLISKAKLNGGVLTPGGSPDSELNQISEGLLRNTNSACEDRSPAENAPIPAMEMLSREDQMGVQRLVGTLGKCVLGLAEASSASTEARMYRRRIEAARRILEGFNDP
ncbi:hypothetical protein B0I35DRAFT_473577 [Stachybotrys elegans]|uniref:Uncharacterized protein n=1 Tax=Stachybotrys elegans TaxID=80388 RepID=A0A8K0WX64_9HYPO|nr:hypothetical protein B0I35DRAFT_473577 [Stachybotrys elegans]